MKKISIILILLCFVLTACGKDSEMRVYSEKDFDELANRSIESLYRLSSDETYMKMHTGSTELINSISELSKSSIASDRQKLVYKVFDAQSFIENQAGLDWDTLSEEVQGFIVSSFPTTLVNMINSSAGADYLAATAVVRASKSYVSDSFEQQIWFIPTNVDEISVYVLFDKAGENVLSVTSGYIYCENRMQGIEDSAGQYFK